MLPIIFVFPLYKQGEMLPVFLEKGFDHFTSQKFRPFDLHKRWRFDLQGSLASDLYKGELLHIFSIFVENRRKFCRFFRISPLQTGRNAAHFSRKRL